MKSVTPFNHGGEAVAINKHRAETTNFLRAILSCTSSDSNRSALMYIQRRIKEAMHHACEVQSRRVPRKMAATLVTRAVIKESKDVTFALGRYGYLGKKVQYLVKRGFRMLL